MGPSAGPPLRLAPAWGVGVGCRRICGPAKCLQDQAVDGRLPGWPRLFEMFGAGGRQDAKCPQSQGDSWIWICNCSLAFLSVQV
jgi:hypothetical protein